VELSYDILSNALVTGCLLGGVYAALTLGLTVSFGLLDIVNIAHPAFVVAGAYIAYGLNASFGLDPILAGLIASPAIFVCGIAIYQLYHAGLERRGGSSIRGLAFFFSLLMLIEVGLLLTFGVDFRSVQTSYIDAVPSFGNVTLPLRLLVPFLVSIAMVGATQALLYGTTFGRAVRAVAQDQIALRLMALDPVRIKALAFGLSAILATLAGSLLIIVQPVEPSIVWLYIGIPFAICVLGGAGSVLGTFLAALIIGLSESFCTSLWGPSWSPALTFGILLLVIAFRPNGLFAR